MAAISGLMRQSLVWLLLGGVGLLIAGRVLGGMEGTLDEFAGLIVLIPALIGLKGNIDTTLGSRLGSAVHLGLITPDNIWNDEMKENIKAAILLSFVMSTFVGILVYVTNLGMTLFGLPSSNPFIIIFTAIFAGTIAGTLLSFITIFVIFLAFKRGYDPDNITGPILATVGDVITLICIFAGALIGHALGTALGVV